MTEELLQGVKENDHVCISRLITIVENAPLLEKSPLQDLNSNKKSIRIGITGPPGAGKSTLTNELIETILANGKTVGIIAVDPTSPFTGGSLLGDRVRMNKYMWDDRVFIRSMGSHGDLGGLARKSQDVSDVLEASGKDFIIFETVGVGQGEIDIASAADITIVVLVPESGDEIQLMKAGLIEIADIFVINKSDRSGANKLASLLKNILHYFSKNNRKEPEVFNVVSTKSIGVAELYLGIQNLLMLMKGNGILEERRVTRSKDRVYNKVSEYLGKVFWTTKKKDKLKKVLKLSDSKSLNINWVIQQILSE
ncbi:MAG: methylmalonyl Co-A mutase-associated GTPase MeaB [Candidatus Marinimicrobia bacterium]|nr:methylmalonyl Co-A mutase-associated GTPase MeaB [Candidatus Neomarinimicrobiota bacterium]